MMGRFVLRAAVVCILVSVSLASAKSDRVSQEVKDWCSEITGQEYWLLTDVIRIQGLYKSTDATNVYPDLRVYHQGTIESGVQITAQRAEEFTAEARRKLGYNKGQSAATVRTMEAGARVLIHNVEAENGEIKIKITLRGSWYAKVRTTVRLKMEKGYTLEDAQQQFEIAFAAEEHLVKHARQTDVVSLGMGPEEVTQILGLPDTRIDLGAKTVLVYDSLRLVFEDDALTDAE